MTAKVVDVSTSLLNSAEEAVLQELQQLPADYTVEVSPTRQKVEDVGHYVPDFIVSDANGRRLILEVKSPHSLSWSNMAKLSSISTHVREHGEGFLLLVVDLETPTRSNLSRNLTDRLTSHFEGLKVQFLEEKGQLQRVVGEALDQLPTAGRNVGSSPT